LSRWYDDAPELELRDAAGSPAAKADLIAASEGGLIVAESESNNTLGSDPREIASPLAGGCSPAVLPGGTGGLPPSRSDESRCPRRYVPVSSTSKGASP
jgi:hypothetical protein